MCERMKKRFILILLFNLVLIAVLAAGCHFMISNVYENEMNTVERIAGSVLAEHPEAESALMSSLEKNDEADETYGWKIMARYGYHDVDSFRDMPRYQRSMEQWLLLLALYFLLLSFVGIVSLWLAEKRKAVQENQILYLLDGFLTDDFPDEDAFSKLQNAHFADTIQKLSRKIQWKTECLNEERDATKTLVTDISHQLKTPISALKSCFVMAMESRDRPEEMEAFLMRCQLQIEKLESLSSALIQISRLESKMIVLRPEPVSLVDLLVNAVNTVYHKAAKKDIEIITEDFSDELLCLDKKWVSEAIANILDNAVKYSPNHTKITMRIYKRYSFMRIEVEDQGIGIPKEEINRIFQRFYRGNHDVVKNQDGSGVGLYLARKIIEDSGGTLSAYSNKQKGSRFVLQLPLNVS